MIKPYFDKIEKSFNKLTLRERGIMFAALFVCILSISYFWMLDPAKMKQVKAEKVLQASYQHEKELDREMSSIKLLLQKDPLKEVSNQLAFSTQTLTILDKQLDDKLVKFIHAQKMPQALAKVLSKSPGIKVSSLISLPVKTFNSSVVTEGEKDTRQEPKNSFYKHSFEIQFVGDYNAIYAYLLNLETQQEKFYWHSLTYQVADYPLAKVTIQIYTLSDQQDLVSG